MCLPKILAVLSFALVGVICIGNMLADATYWIVADIGIAVVLIVSGVYMFTRDEMSCKHTDDKSKSD